MPRSPLLAALAIAALVASARAQDAPEPPFVHHGFAFRDVLAGAADARPTIGRPTLQPIVATANGDLLAAVHHRTGPNSIAPTDRVTLHRSRDGGETWSETATLPGRGVGFGATLATDPRRDVVHVAWMALGEDTFVDAWYGEYDAARDTWVGDPVELAHGTGAEDQYLVHDLIAAPTGHVAVALSAHRRPPANWGAWSSALRIRGPGESGFSEPIRINRGSSGVTPDLALDGSRIVASYRTFGSDFGIHHRAFDLARGLDTTAFVDASDRPVSPHPEEQFEPSNTSTIAMEPGGAFDVLINRGPRSHPPTGYLEVVHVAPGPDGTPVRTRQRIANDTGLLGGNYNYTHFALSRGPGDHQVAVFSKIEEQHSRLYVLTLIEGRPVGGPELVAADAPGAFEVVAGIRDERLAGQVLAVVAGTTKAAPKGRVAVLARRWPLRVRPRAAGNR